MNLREMMQWLSKLLPKQKMLNAGDGNVQAGRVQGDLNHSQNTQTVYNNTIFVLPGKDAALSTCAFEAAKGAGEQVIAEERLALLRLMRTDDSLETRGRAFMHREFGGAYVKGLERGQVFRTRRYLEACINNDKLKQQQETA